MNLLAHIIQHGDNIYNLANRYHTSVWSIIAVNPNMNPRYLYYGQKIWVPVEGTTGQVTSFQNNSEIPTPESLNRMLAEMEAERGILDLMKDLIFAYGRLYDKYLITSGPIDILSTKIEEAKSKVNGYAINPPQNLSIAELEELQKEIMKLGKEAIELYDSMEGLLFTTTLYFPTLVKVASTFYLDKLPIISNIIDGLEIIINSLESNLTDKIKNLKDDVTELTNDINNLLTQKYASLIEECKTFGPQKEPEVPLPPKQPEVELNNVSGKWDTNWGEMTLEQIGNTVTGSYIYDKGRITGTLKGNILSGTWSEAPSYNVPRDAGGFEFIFGQNSFTGSWGYGDEKLTGLWEGTRRTK